MSKSLKKLIDINRLREFKNKLVGTDSPCVQTAAVDQTIAGTKTFSKPIVGSVTGSSGSCTGNSATATKLATARTIALSGGATGTATSFNGTANIAIPVTSLDASKLTGTASVSTTGNAATATKLATARTISLTGAVTGSTSFNGSANASINTTLSNIDASKITSGTIDLARIPKAAIPELKIVANDTARFALTISDIQNGDTVKVESTGKMYYVKDQTKLSSEDGYAVYTAGAASSVPWSGVTGKPSSYTPAAHTQAASTITGLATVATSGSYTDLANKPAIPTVNNATLTIQKNGTTVKTFTANASANVTANITVPTKTSELTNNSGFLTSHSPVDSSLSSTSTNAIQNKVVNAALDNKANNSEVVHKSGDETIAGTKTFSNGVLSTALNAFMAQSGGYTLLIRIDSKNAYLLMSDKDGVPGSFNSARPLTISNSTGVCNINGNAATATTATTAKACTGNATSATKLQTARTINGTSFNGTANITTANWGTARDISITDGTNTSTAVSVNGSANVSLNLPDTIKATFVGNVTGNVTGNCSGSSGSCTGNAATATTATTAKSCTGNAATATKLATARSLWGNNFDGSAAITGTITGTPSIEFKPVATTVNNGGFLDFHYNQSTADYTSRIIESASGTLSINNVTITTGKVVTATTFNGALKGNVTGNCSGSSGSCTGNAATATKATQDSDGNQINTTYSKNGHTHDDRYYTEAEVNNLLAGKANTSHTHNSVRTLDNNNNISFDWSSQASGFVGLTVDSIKQGGIVTTITLGEIGVYGIGSTVLAITGTWIDYGEITAGSGLKYAALDRNGGIYDLDTGIGATGTWVKVSGNSGGTGGFGLYRRIA